jgi:hypothetical protein
VSIRCCPPGQPPDTPVRPRPVKEPVRRPILGEHGFSQIGCRIRSVLSPQNWSTKQEPILGAAELPKVLRSEKVAKTLVRLLVPLLELTVNELETQKVHFQSITDGIDTKTPAGRFFFHVMASLAQMETGPQFHGRSLLLTTAASAIASSG